MSTKKSAAKKLIGLSKRLDRLIAGVQSENIKHYLEEAASNIYYLVYEQEVAETDEEIDQAA